jgi:multisubunit Na+/H+ antiporter MnhE subunit
MMFMAKKKQKTVESDSLYFLKLVLFFVLGAFWMHFEEPISVGDFLIYGLPVGLVVGLIFASHDHFRVDRKIEYAILLVMTVIGFVVPYVGIFI